MKKFSSLLIVLLLMLASFRAGLEFPRGDVDQDGRVTVGDVTCLIDYLLNGTWGDEPVTPPDEHEWVDLGLPSGTLWATCNVGADNPEDYGGYFAWGETDTEDYYDWDTYKWCDGTMYSITKYCIHSEYGTVDNKTELDPEDDAAYVNWGPSWRIPTTEQQQELVNNCTWTWTTRNNVKGQLVTGPNGNTIFLPAAGYRCFWSLNDAGTRGYYWLRSIYPSYSDGAYLLYFTSAYADSDYYRRCNGQTIRPVRVP